MVLFKVPFPLRWPVASDPGNRKIKYQGYDFLYLLFFSVRSNILGFLLMAGTDYDLFTYVNEFTFLGM